MRPTALIATTSCWVPTARLTMALANAGFAVSAVCPPRHPLLKTGSVRETHAYQGLAPLRSFKDAITAAKPDVIVPGDDVATQHLHEIYHREERATGSGGPICALIERSLGAPQSFPLVYARTALIQAAQQGGVRAPATEVVATSSDLKKWIARAGFPTVLKADCSFGGYGVKVVHTMAEAQAALRALASPPLLARAVKQALIDRDATLVWPSLLRRRCKVNAQAFVPGCDATSTVVCWNGRVLASLHFEVLKKAHPSGPSTVLRLIEDPEMVAAAEKIASRLKLSGIHGFDFVRAAGAGNTQLIEMNARATQVGHLALGPGRDLAAALYAAVSGEPLQAAPKVTESDTIVLYPQEWIRNPRSPFIRSGYHDVPWGAPDLVLYCVQRRRKQRASYSQADCVQAVSSPRLPHL
jgi:Carbamoyl-phosphate synthase L chain, ATP binding domain